MYCPCIKHKEADLRLCSHMVTHKHAILALNLSFLNSKMIYLFVLDNSLTS